MRAGHRRVGEELFQADSYLPVALVLMGRKSKKLRTCQDERLPPLKTSTRRRDDEWFNDPVANESGIAPPYQLPGIDEDKWSGVTRSSEAHCRGEKRFIYSINLV